MVDKRKLHLSKTEISLRIFRHKNNMATTIKNKTDDSFKHAKRWLCFLNKEGVF